MILDAMTPCHSSSLPCTLTILAGDFRLSIWNEWDVMHLQDRWRAWKSGSAEARMRDTRAALPAHERRAAFLQALQQSRVVVIQGATGSGKSTQMPQYILEEAGLPPQSLARRAI